MKIDPGVKQVSLPPTVENRTSQHNTGKAAGSGQTAVTLSPQAAQLKQLESELAAIPVVDRARVDSIKEAIASGQYTINTSNIGEHLIDSVKEMLHVAK